MKNLMILTLLLIFAVGCKSEAVEEIPVKVNPEVIPATEEVLPEEVVE